MENKEKKVNNKDQNRNQQNGEQKTIEKINKSKNCLFKKIGKVDKPSTRLLKNRREKMQIIQIRNENGGIMTRLTEIKKQL